MRDNDRCIPQSYMVTVKATDPGGLPPPMITVTIMVTDDLDEPPTITSRG